MRFNTRQRSAGERASVKTWSRGRRLHEQEAAPDRRRPRGRRVVCWRLRRMAQLRNWPVPAARSGWVQTRRGHQDRALPRQGPSGHGCVPGGDHALAFRATPWVDWSNYWATGDSTTKSTWFIPLPKHLSRNSRGEDGGLLDLEYARIELIKFNLFDNATFEHYVSGRGDTSGRVLDRK